MLKNTEYYAILYLHRTKQYYVHVHIYIYIYGISDDT